MSLIEISQELVEQIDSDLNQVRDGFKVTNLESANWCFRKIRSLKKEIEEKKALAQAEITRVTTWLEQENKSYTESIKFFENLIKEYYITLKLENPKVKLSTPYGKVSCRKSNKWRYGNEEVLKEYLKKAKLDEFIRIKEEINKSELKKVFKNGVNLDTGEIIPEIQITEEEDITIMVED